MTSRFARIRPGDWTINELNDRAGELAETEDDHDAIFESLIGELYPDDQRVPRPIMRIVGKAAYFALH
jgi:rubrerythrin